MKIRCKRTDLLKGLQIVQGVIPTRAGKPILLNILFKTQKEELKLFAADLEVGINCSVPVKVEKSGNIAIPGKLITGVVREAPDGEIEIAAGSNNSVKIKTGAGSFEIMGLSGDEFPEFPGFKSEESLMISKADLYEILKKTSFAALQHSETMHIFGGIYFSIKDKSLTVVATDGYRLARIKKSLNIKLEKKVIVPLKSVNKLWGILEENVQDVDVFIGEKQIMFRVGKTVLVSQLIDEQFIEYERIIPKAFNEKITVDCDGLHSLLKRVSLVTTDRLNIAKVSFSGGKASFTVNTPEVGEAKEDIDVSFDGEKIELMLNPDYVMDFLRNVGSAKIDINIVDKGKPIVLSPSETGNYIYVIMPIKL